MPVLTSPFRAPETDPTRTTGTTARTRPVTSPGSRRLSRLGVALSTVALAAGTLVATAPAAAADPTEPAPAPAAPAAPATPAVPAAPDAPAADVPAADVAVGITPASAAPSARPARLTPAQIRARQAAARAARVAAIRTSVVRVARAQLGESYVAGASGPNAFDCSGFTRYVLRVAAGRDLPHYSRAQYAMSKKIKLSQARPGDLVFFFRNGAHHVGLYIGGGKMIHAANPRADVLVSRVHGPWYGAHFSGVGRIIRG